MCSCSFHLFMFISSVAISNTIFPLEIDFGTNRYLSLLTIHPGQYYFKSQISLATFSNFHFRFAYLTKNNVWNSRKNNNNNKYDNWIHFWHHTYYLTTSMFFADVLTFKSSVAFNSWRFNSLLWDVFGLLLLSDVVFNPFLPLFITLSLIVKTNQ